MERIEKILSMIDNALKTKRKRHIIGGVLLSASLFFGGLAVTAVTIKMEDKHE
jgi:hypothetical protein